MARTTKPKAKTQPQSRTTPAVAKTHTRPRRSLLYVLLACAALVALVTLSYANSLGNGFVWDDHQQIVLNPNIKADAPIARVFTSDVRFVRHREMIENTDYRPLQMFTYRLLVGEYGADATVFHACSVIFAVGCALAAFAVLLLLTQRLPVAFAAAALFATYPVHSEAVDWIAALPELGCTLFLLLSFALFLNSHAKRWLIVGLSALAYAIALLWKETALVFPLLIAAYVLLDARRTARPWRTALVLSAPYWVVLGGYMALRYSLLGEFATGPRDWALTPVQLGLNAAWLMVCYWAKLALPIGLNAYYNFVPIRSFADPRALTAIAFVAMLIAGGVAAWRWMQRQPGPDASGELLAPGGLDATARLALFAALWVVVALLPAMNVAALGRNPFTERYLYLPSVGFCLLLALAGAWLVERIPLKLRFGSGVALLLAVVGAFTWETIARNPDWKDDATLWSQTLLLSPDAPFVRMMVASTQSSDPAQAAPAEENYRKSIELGLALTPPDLMDAATSYQGLALIYSDRSNFKQALEFVSEAEKLDPQDPNISGEKGLIQTRAGNGKDAVPLLQQALAAEPNNENVLSALGLAERDALHDPAAAEQMFERVLAAHTEEDEFAANEHNNLGAAFGDEGRFDRAAEEFRAATRIEPSNEEYQLNLAISLGNLGRLPEARAAATAAMQLAPNDPTPRQLLNDLSKLPQ
jgi:Flp pilus assembly protein TadD